MSDNEIRDEDEDEVTSIGSGSDEAKQVLATGVLKANPGKGPRALPEIHSPHLFMGAPFMKVKPSAVVSGIPPLDIALPIAGVPHGLEYLVPVDHILFVNQSIDIADEVVGVFQASNWHLMNTKGQRLYIAAEIKVMRKSCCPSVESRPFNVNILDAVGTTVLKITRPVTCALCWWGGDSCGSIVSVFDDSDQLIGFIKQKVNPCVTTYELYNNLNQKILNIKSSKCKCWYTREKNEFEIYRFHPTTTKESGNVKDTKVSMGKIKKNWSGFSDLTTADTFGIKFPEDIDVTVKATLIGAVLLINFQFFEARNGKCTGCLLLLWFCAFCILLYLLIVAILFHTGRGGDDTSHGTNGTTSKLI